MIGRGSKKIQICIRKYGIFQFRPTDAEEKRASHIGIVPNDDYIMSMRSTAND